MSEPDTESDDDSTGKVGVITAIEHVNGKMIDMGDVDGKIRNQWIEHIEEQLEALEGVAEVWGAGNTHLNNQTGQFEIQLEHSTPRWGDGVEIDANLRSLGQKIPGVFRDSHYVSSHEVTMKPESTGSDRHDHPTYVVEFYFP